MTDLIFMSTLKNIELIFNDVGHFPARISELISNLPMFNLYYSLSTLLKYPSLDICGQNRSVLYLWPALYFIIAFSKLS